MRFLLYMLALGLLLGGCGQGQENAKADAALKAQADIAKSKLQEKADALAKSAANPPSDNKTGKANKP
jgi:hypothetical protein